MKKYISALILSAQFGLMFQTIAQTQPQFVLYSQIDGLKDGVKVYLVKENAANRKLLDTVGVAISKDEKFGFKGQIPDNIGFFYLQMNATTVMTQCLTLINAEMKLRGDWQLWPKIELTGSEPHLHYQEILKLNAEMNARLKAESADIATAKSRKASVFKSYINSHLNALITPFLIDQLIGTVEISELRALYSTLGQDAKNGSFGLLLNKKLNKAEKLATIQVGSTIPDFNLTMSDGTVASIKSLAAKNKITLIDFWASWCKPCRMENPNLTEVYNAFHDKGFGILGISSDKKSESWKKALMEDNTLWLHGLDTELAGQNIFEIKAIPSYMMIDQKGKILALELLSPIKAGGNSLRGKGLHATVKSLFEGKVKR